ncbi:MAG: nickel/cobalt efflux transporter [Pseudomonadota bacterium]|uniref:nickel/cobalt efflux transporter n=1 Tax=Gallaecimonas pentaromativorans TaxID=584787 RepID=UPI00067E9101|nr:nickel/cobalt efflux transporter [Gallaecimonas pentaromativorans]MED5526623.1 nickel/cobalt efflux transporter [Pseudomonadota bacterium]
METFSTLLAQGNAWLFIPSAILLGALHGLEPGHSKTMMAAFIVAIRGTLTQAVLLGLAATVSHTLVVWAVAMTGLYFGSHWNAEQTEPYFQLASGGIIVVVALWMFWRTWPPHHHHHHDHDHDYDYYHDHDHSHSHAHPHGAALILGDGEYQDAHERAHGEDIRRRFSNREVTTGQIVLFGLTGGLIPCPASITVLLLCLQLKKVALGATLVLSFSIGLALTLVASGALAAFGVRHASKRFAGFGEFARKAPYFSSLLIGMVGLYLGYQGLAGLMHG